MSELRYPNESREYREARDSLSDDMQWSVMQVFSRRDAKIFHFWGTELSGNHVDTVWPYWNPMVPPTSALLLYESVRPRVRTSRRHWRLLLPL